MPQGVLFGSNLEPVKFWGSDLTNRDTTRLKGNLKKVFNVLLQIGWHTNDELYRETGLYCGDRYRRKIGAGEIEGYGIEKKNLGNGVFKYRIVKIGEVV